MRILVMDDNAKKKVAAVREYAEKREHWYILGPGAKPKTACPGDIPEHVCMLDTYRCVFSWTRDETGKVWRHISVSVPAPDKFPNPAVFFEIANLFGLTGADPNMSHIPLDWELYPDSEERCIKAAQPVQLEKVRQ